MNKLKAQILVGCSASGKSSYTKELVRKEYDWINIERDVIREFIMTTQYNYPSLGNFIMVDNLYQHWKFNAKNEGIVSEEFDIQVDRAYRNKKNIVCSDTNLNKGRRDALKLKLEALGYEVEYKVFGLELTLEDLWKRDLNRKNSVGRDVIWRQWKTFNAEFGTKPIIFNKELPKRFLVDLDGTLAMHTSGRNPYEWSRVNEDTVNEFVLAMMYGLTMTMSGDLQPIFMSGRDSVCREATISWLVDNTNYNQEYINENLYMRKQDDMRSDMIIKEELIKEHLVDKYNIVCALDDRKKVIRHYNLLGIYTIDCGNPMDEF